MFELVENIILHKNTPKNSIISAELKFEFL